MSDDKDGLAALIEGLSSSFPLLFVGSGFSANALDKNGDRLPTGRALIRLLHEQLNIPIKYELDTISREYIHKLGEHTLFELLKAKLLPQDIPQYIGDVAAFSWKRIYTTNYDSVIEISRSRRSVASNPIDCTASQSVPEKPGNTSVVHINGILDGVDFPDFASRIKLTKASYLTNTFVESPWYWRFKTDLSIAGCAVIIGYSVYDIDIARILYSDPVLKSRLFFIEVDDIDPVLRRELEQYGTVLNIGVEQFAEIVLQVKRAERTAQELISFELESLPTDSRRPTSDDVLKLLLYGGTDYPALLGQGIHGTPYVVRREVESAILDRLSNGPSRILIHSDLGNGKSVLSESVKMRLLQTGRTVLHVNASDETLGQDLAIVSSRFVDPIFFVDDVFRFSETVKIILSEIPGASVVAMTRSSIYELRSYRVTEILGDNYTEYDVNKLSSNDVQSFVKVIDDNGLWADFSNRSQKDKEYYVHSECKAEIRNLLVSLFKSPSIREKIIKAFNEQPSSEALRIICITLFLDIAGFHPDIMLVGQLSGIDVFTKRELINNQFSMEIIERRHGNIQLKSAVFGEYVLQHVVDVDYVVDLIVDVVKRCERVGQNKLFFELQKELIRFSFIDRIFARRKMGDKYKVIYDRLKELPSMARNPLFWLQFAISRLEDGNYPACEIHFRTAYSHANRKANFDTFQIDNHYARFLLESRTKDVSYRDDFKVFLDAHSLLVKQAVKEEDAYYPFRVASGYLAFYIARGMNYDANQKNVIRKSAEEVISRARLIPRNTKKHHHVEQCLANLGELLKALG
ncbi:MULTISPECIES: SIR2 family protein [unclassified Mesorhizobium]|uniref:SIR2 family protein n=1 Tax=unclassified Mesorhizobium TaxID=325217 RepID=UPI00112EA21E|nr:MULTISPECIES: SIR2 family protein [unclassified Mesorhizobium]TPJ55719.1 hypothetical protein FJ426_03485 [Mesorhizobium sp. B2-6-4]TPK59712.1 hypothetical protein FJ551_22855 [Mesorhizobium sp. B2-5-1]TPM66693.1 hypothetical protein FJ962_01560 [Mesorhizobium sp. B2-1-9]TPM89003.1 hypothetical protein FJ963_01815 [Mesorhizobium sp. B2-1-4]TPN08995.1 hypothetical protein FJ971_19075 [Mesorhizobium sp. B2-1-2]